MSQSTSNSFSRAMVRNAAITIGVLLIPLIAMQFSSEVQWDVRDFVTIAVLLFGMGLVYELLARMVHKKEHRIAIGFFLAILLLYIWAELAVGVFTNWGS